MIHRSIIYLISLTAALHGASCETEQKNPGSAGSGGSSSQNGNTWLIPRDDVLDGGPGKDGIPALANPPRAAVDDATHDYLSNDDLILGFSDGDQVVGYPHDILDWHEIINDHVGTVSLAVTYCPLTGTGVGWDRVLEGSETTFGVSGLLYNSNLIPYDRKTDSYWSQIRLDCVKGDFIGKHARLHPLIEMTWASWKALFPESRVVTRETGHNRNYGVYPYGGYKESEALIFPASPVDERLHAKERVFAVLNEQPRHARVYRFESFAPELGTINDTYFNDPLVIIGKRDDFLIAYHAKDADGRKLRFEPHDEGSIRDHEGGLWNLFGECVSGPREGQQLRAARGFMGYWFSIAAFYPDPDIHGQ